MKYLFVVIALLWSLNSMAQDKKELKPVKKVASVKVDGKYDYTYYALSPKASTTYKLVGPGKLYVNVRTRITDQQKGFQSPVTQVKYTRSGEYVKVQKIPALKASNLKYKSKSLQGVPSRYYRFEIDVPPGKHQYTFLKEDAESKIHMRLFYKAAPKPKWQDLQPEDHISERQVRFSKSGKRQKYHELRKKQDQFKFSVAQGEKIKLTVRPEFTYRMLSETTVRLEVMDDLTGEKKVYKFNSKRSKYALIEGAPKLVPASPRKIYLEIPQSGDYSIRLISGAQAALVRVSVDQQNQNL